MHRVLNRLGDDLLILLFHGVIEEQVCQVRNYTRKHILRRTFVELMRSLSGAGIAVSMDQLLEMTLDGHPFPKRAFAVTFDDGFENNASVAAPVLDGLNIPATFYISTAFVDEGRSSWIDRLEAVFEVTPAVLVPLPWRTGLVHAVGVEEKITLLDEIRHEVKERPELDPDTFAEACLRVMGLRLPPVDVPALDQKMSWEQVRELHSHPLFTVGGHTHTHAILSRLSRAALEYELDTSLALLRDKAGVGPRHYSYPEGQKAHFSPDVIEALKARGVVCCPTAVDGVTPPGADPFLLRRIMVNL